MCVRVFKMCELRRSSVPHSSQRHFTINRYNASTDMHLALDVPTSVSTQLEKASCDFWANHYTKYYFD